MHVGDRASPLQSSMAYRPTRKTLYTYLHTGMQSINSIRGLEDKIYRPYELRNLFKRYKHSFQFYNFGYGASFPKSKTRYQNNHIPLVVYKVCSLFNDQWLYTIQYTIDVAPHVTNEPRRRAGKYLKQWTFFTELRWTITNRINE